MKQFSWLNIYVILTSIFYCNVLKIDVMLHENDILHAHDTV